MLSPQWQPRIAVSEPVPGVLYYRGACVDPEVDPEWFSPDATPRMAARAQRVCVGCPVARVCRDFAERTEQWGVWSGVMYRHHNNPADLQTRQAAHELFTQGYNHSQVAGLLDISVHTAIGYRTAWRREQERRSA